ncbi:MAG: nucleoside-diphosphate kinase [Kiritimatiellia bacterium]|nr:nucleoside-diphosphate kinase [Lentisphaerota bacterium]
MGAELGFVLINPYTISKSRTGGVIGRFLSRTGLELAEARMFAPSLPLARQYADLVRGGLSRLPPATCNLLADYILKNYTPDPLTGRPRRVMLILLEGEDAIRRVSETAGHVAISGGETVRDTFGDYVVDERGNVQYFEPAVLISRTHEETAAVLKLWGAYSDADAGIVQHAGDSLADAPGWQRTLVLIKPDNFRFPNARPGNIIDLLSRSGLRIIAANVHRMSMAQAEEFYRPVRQILREKMKDQVTSVAVRLLEKELHISIPAPVVAMLENNLGPLIGDEHFNQLIKFMTGFYPPTCKPEAFHKEGNSKCLALIYSGVNAVAKIRNLLGSTDPSKAPTGSVRREFGHDIMVNAAHASDSVENAEREIKILDVARNRITERVRLYYG